MTIASSKLQPNRIKIATGHSLVPTTAMPVSVGFLLGDPSWEDSISELCAESESFAALWARNDVAVPHSRTKQIRNLAVAELEMFLTSMSLPVLPHAWMQIYAPTDEVVWAKLHELLAMSDEERQRPWSEHSERYHAAAG